MPLSPLLQSYEQVILDLDGCVWVGPDALPGAADAIVTLRDAGKRVAFVTNDPRHAGEEFVRKLWGIGVQASLADVVTVGAAVQHLLAETRRGGTAFVIGTPAFRRHVADAGSGREAAIVGKPEPQLFFTALDRLGDGSTLVIGDRLDADVAAAAKARLDAALVLTGGTSRAEAAAAPKELKPVVIADSLAALVDGSSGG